jgi:hypothetical protein
VAWESPWRLLQRIGTGHMAGEDCQGKHRGVLGHRTETRKSVASPGRYAELYSSGLIKKENGSNLTFGHFLAEKELASKQPRSLNFQHDNGAFFTRVAKSLPPCSFHIFRLQVAFLQIENDFEREGDLFLPQYRLCTSPDFHKTGKLTKILKKINV